MEGSFESIWEPKKANSQRQGNAWHMHLECLGCVIKEQIIQLCSWLHSICSSENIFLKNPYNSNYALYICMHSVLPVKISNIHVRGFEPNSITFPSIASHNLMPLLKTFTHIWIEVWVLLSSIKHNFAALSISLRSSSPGHWEKKSSPTPSNNTRYVRTTTTIMSFKHVENFVKFKSFDSPNLSHQNFPPAQNHRVPTNTIFLGVLSSTTSRICVQIWVRACSLLVCLVSSCEISTSSRLIVGEASTWTLELLPLSICIVQKRKNRKDYLCDQTE